MSGGNGHVDGNGRRLLVREATNPLRIALLATPMVPVPPRAYGGTERVVAALASELIRRGHDVTVFAAGDSDTEARVDPIIPRALWTDGYRGDVSAYMLKGVARCWARQHEFDIIHSHAEAFGFLLARHADVPVVSTLHGRLDEAGMPDLLADFSDIPLVAISHSQRRWHPEANWLGVVYNGLLLEAMPGSNRPGDYLLFVGRVALAKGIGESIELAGRLGLPLKMAAKVHDPAEHELYHGLVAPAVAEGKVEFLGELMSRERDALYAGASATLMLGGWPEPFGLVAIESLACGTPVIARRAGALPEIVEHGVDGYLVDDLQEAELAVRLLPRLDRGVIRQRALERFSAARMAADYEAVYDRLLAGARARTARPSRAPTRAAIAVG